MDKQGRQQPPRQPFRWKPLALLLTAFIVVDKCAHLPYLQQLVADAVADVELSRGVDAGDAAASRALNEVSHASTPEAVEEAETTNSTHSEEEEHAEHEVHSHPHVAMVGLIAGLVIGTGILNITFYKWFHGLQTTVALFVVGMVASILIDATGLKEYLGIGGDSYDMWMEIDPHLMLFTLLPPLLAGDAMTINTQVAMKVACQCLYLAGPGVALGSGLSAAFLYFYLPYNWDFLMCLTMGSILSATDPVAVVALLKELGASPTLTVQIQGESLLNDGTAIVLYSVAYRMLSGEELSAGEVVMFLVKAALYAWMLGMFVGWVFQRWIRSTRDVFDHNSALIQVALTIACAYLSFVLAEGQFHISGVLSTVAASIVLAHSMWLDVVDKETMHTIWHMFEYLGNTLIFFLAGALTGRAMVRIDWIDYVHLLVLYVVLVIIRGVLIIGSKPLLTLLHPDHQPVTLADCLVMTWGGLRGAVGLALAMMVNMDRAGDKLSQKDADRALFFVGGVAFLTLVVNATSCPALVKRLGITRVTEAKSTLMKLLVQQVATVAGQLDGSDKATKTIHDMVHDLEHHIPSDVVTEKVQRVARPTAEIITELTAAQAEYTSFYNEKAHRRLNKELMKLMPPHPLSQEIDQLISRCKDAECKPCISKAVNEVFLTLVSKKYEHFIDIQDVPKTLGEVLLSSTTRALSTQHDELEDFEYLKCALGMSIKRRLGQADVEDFREAWKDLDLAENVEATAEKKHTKLHLVVESAAFSAFITVAILLNAALVLVEDELNLSSSLYVFFFVCEVLFTIIFFTEFMLRLLDQKCAYWRQAWNLFDFVLVVMSFVSVIYGVLVFLHEAERNDATDNSQAARGFKVLKTLRAVRLVRLFHVTEEWISRRGVTPNDDVRIRRRVKKFDLFLSFIRAHTQAQQHLVRFFGRDQPEICRCILESQRAVYEAMLFCAHEKKYLPSWILEESHNCRRALVTLKHFEDLAKDSHSLGLFSAREAHEIVHTLQSHVKKYQARVNVLRNGGDDRPMWNEDGSLTVPVGSYDNMGAAASEYPGEDPVRIGKPQPTDHE